jgi:replicative DNA helicase
MKSKETIQAPPCNIYAERFILGGFLINNSEISECGLVPSDFSIDSHQRIFQAIWDLNQDGRGVDYVTLADRLKDLDSVGGMPYLVDLTRGMPRRPAIADYIKIVKEKAHLRRIIQACQKAIEKSYEQVESAESIAKTLRLKWKD